MSPQINIVASPFNENNDSRGFVVHKLGAYVGDQEVGYIKLSYVASFKWDSIIQDNPWIFRRLFHGCYDLPDSFFNSSIEEINDYYKKNYSFYGSTHGEVTFNKSKYDMEWYKNYFVDKPIVDFISSNMPRKGLATLLHYYAIKFLRESFDLKLYKSTCITDSGKPFYRSEKTRKRLPLKKVKALKKQNRKDKRVYNHCLNVDREYFIFTNEIKELTAGDFPHIVCL